MRDRADNCVVVCSIENFDPMGVHTGDSITVAPAQTLSDVEYQRMRDAAFACIRRIGVETGGSNIQFAVNPADGDMVVIEMNPRVSRSSALWRRRRPASRSPRSPPAWPSATRLDEIANDITGSTPACFEPTIDYVVTKVPRWAFEKFPGTPAVLGTRMQSVGEAMAIGRTFPESLQKALALPRARPLGLELRPGRGRPRRARPTTSWCARRPSPRPTARSSSRRPSAEASPWSGWPRPPASTRGSSTRSHSITEMPAGLAASGGPGELDRRALAAGEAARLLRRAAGLAVGRRRGRGAGRPSGAAVSAAVFKTVDTCAAEFDARTPYHYSTYEDTTRCAPATAATVIILGSGPNRIGQGIEFDYCCVHASFALRDAGLRDRHGQLQPRDGVDRLRHQRPPLLRAAHRRGRAATSSTPSGRPGRWWA